ncbi:unnamed protein product [Moneuplotes crassus]|uniref:Selenoprotein W n=1 Tax=Euplotes crassus TaxID=5936 RepID=A0AAD2D4C6_EUPCR|nr:unnamed protein product [Moneuplotes crassus]
MGGCQSNTRTPARDLSEYTMNIQYCGGCSYRPKAVFVQKDIKKHFGGKVNVVFDRDSSLTGNFEITITDKKTGKSQLLHSKKNGDGFVKKETIDDFREKVQKFCSS